MCEQTNVMGMCVGGGGGGGEGDVLRSCLKSVVVQHGEGHRKVLEKHISVRERSVKRKSFTK